ncbi:MAG: 3-methyl-2-oxobutanoate dehydrogenase subunit VorB [Oscillospiraceae bacterium]|nr:3-methyl-2-oxobutanoate dehydrogenase subunit VorB [Oscillospiraceae bacterium]
MGEKVLMKGNEAIGEAVIRSGCRHFFGYPITPQTELSVYMAKKMPKIGGVFLQAESEVAAINMVYGAAAAGVRAMTSSSSPGISLKSEGISYLVAGDLPCVIVNIVRGGPGLGGIQPAQSDYFQATRGGGHGDYHLIVLAPNSVQELVYLTADAFNLSDEYRIPVMLLGDGTLGQMMEPVDFDSIPEPVYAEKPWAATGTENKRDKNVIETLFLEATELEERVLEREKKYDVVKEKLQRYEAHNTDDADIIISSYGITSRVVETAVKILRDEGIKAGVIRPITLWPFPEKIYKQVKPKAFLSVEMSTGQMVEDIRLACECSVPVYFCGRTGGVIPTPDEVVQKVKDILKEVK